MPLTSLPRRWQGSVASATGSTATNAVGGENALAARLRRAAGPSSVALVRAPARRPPVVDRYGRTVRDVGGLAVPIGPPPALPGLRQSVLTTEGSTLRQAGLRQARDRAQLLAYGGEADQQLRAQEADVLGMNEAVEQWTAYGVNAFTAVKDERAWKFWLRVCDKQGTSPHRTAVDVRDFPERNARLLCALLLHAFAVCKPTDKTRHFVKPRSALAYPLAIIRIFGRWQIRMPGSKVVTSVMNGLMRAYVAYHGPMSLAPKRAEPMKFSMMIDMLTKIPAGAQVGKWRWVDADHDVFTFKVLNAFLMSTGFRLGELTRHGSGEIMYITRECVAWRIDGVWYLVPTRELLAQLKSNRDVATVHPGRSKADQWGEIHCPFPVTLPFIDEPGNAAAALRDLELARPCAADERGETPLFADAEGMPYSGGFLQGILSAALTFLYSAAIASLYSFHSYRAGLATALRAAGVPDPVIQLMCRWMCPDSLRVYARAGTAENVGHLLRAEKMNVDSLQATNLPTIMMDQAYAKLSEEWGAEESPLQRDWDEELQRVQGFRTAGSTGGAHPKTPTKARTPPRPGAKGSAHKAAKSSAARSPKRARTAPEAEACVPQTVPLQGRPAQGDLVVIPALVWPEIRCLENGGVGWTARVVSSSACNARLHFVQARTADQRPFEDVRLEWAVLHRAA